MSKDYLMYCQNCADLPKLAQLVHDKYKPYIAKFAHSYSRQSNYKIDAEDFVSDVYIKLIKQIETIRIDKIKNIENFNFHVYVRQAAYNTRTQDKKISKQKEYFETLNYESFEKKQYNTVMYCNYNYDEHLHSKELLKAIYRKCNETQRKVFLGRLKDKTYSGIAKEMNISKQRVEQIFKTIVNMCENKFPQFRM